MSYLGKLLFFVAIFMFSSFVLCESEENFAIQLDETTFDNAIEENNHFVMFYAPWCGHCKSLHPTWEKLAEIMNVKDPNVIIGKVDCTKEKALCAKHSVTGYPTMLFFKLGKDDSVRFRGIRDMPTITDFIQEQLREDSDETESKEKDLEEKKEAEEKPTSNLIELTEENFAKQISSGNHFIKFYAPWCSHCQKLAPTWEKLSKSLQHETALQISKIDCTVYRSVCLDFDVKGYPTLLWIEDGKKIDKYSGSRNHDDLITYANKMLRGSNEKIPDISEDSITESEKFEKNKDKVLELTGITFKSSIENGVTFIKFYAPWCGHCQHLSPTWDQLAVKIHNKKSGIKIAKVDCTAAENKDLCLEQQIEGYPTLFAYKDGKKLSEYDGGRSFEDLHKYIDKMVGHDEL